MYQAYKEAKIMNISQISNNLGFNGLAVLYEAARVLSAGGDLGHILSSILKLLESHAGMKRGIISILNNDKSELAIEVAHGITPSSRQKGKYRLGEGITGQVAASGKAIAIPKIENHPEFLDKTGLRKNLKLPDLAFLCVPIKSGNAVIGVLSVDRVSVETPVTLEGELSFLEAIANLISEVVEQRRKQNEIITALEKENWELRQILENRGRPDEMIGNSGSMREVYRHIAQVAPSMTTVLVRGETGTGKELVARAIHQKSVLREGPFIAVNCAAIPENLVESELFGHEKGSFTGALNSRIGKFEAANNGTLFLDEIAELSMSAQGRLLRAIQEREIQKIGSTDPVRVRVRLVAATNRDLERHVSEGSFREDLFYRINVFTVALPPLRERGADIMLLADHFVKKYSKLHHKQINRISTPAIELLSSHTWPGNIRELENVIERSTLVAEGNVVEGHDLPPVLQQVQPAEPGPCGIFENMVSSYERELIIDALKDSDGNQTEAAELLGTTKRIIQYKINKYNIDFRRYRNGTSGTNCS